MGKTNSWCTNECLVTKSSIYRSRSVLKIEEAMKSRKQCHWSSYCNSLIKRCTESDSEKNKTRLLFEEIRYSIAVICYLSLGKI